jgi:UMF1 family MFS transporter
MGGASDEEDEILGGARGMGNPIVRGDGAEEEEALLSSTLGPPSIASIPLPRDYDMSSGLEAGKCHSTLLSLTMSRISSTGVAIGFFSGVAVLALLIIPVTLGEGSTASLRLAIGLSGIWWAVFTLPSWIALPGGMRKDGDLSSGTSLTGAWKRVGRMVSPKEMRRLPSLYTFLLAWIFLSDGEFGSPRMTIARLHDQQGLTKGFHTTTYTAILYASSTLRLPPSRIILIGILVQLVAVISSVYTPRFQLRKGYTNSQVLLRIVILALILPIYTCIGLVLPFGGLRTEGEMYVAATWFGLVCFLRRIAAYTDCSCMDHSTAIPELFTLNSSRL